jgi:hypothetical protein
MDIDGATRASPHAKPIPGPRDAELVQPLGASLVALRRDVDLGHRGAIRRHLSNFQRAVCLSVEELAGASSRAYGEINGDRPL